jgi:hypothetical protein
MPVSFRHYWPEPVSSGWLNLNTVVVREFINRHFGIASAIVMTACEYKRIGEVNLLEVGNGEGVKLWRGDAEIWVSNVRPYIRRFDPDPAKQDGGVEFFLHVGFDSPLLIATTLTIFDGSPSISPDDRLVEVI